MINWFKQHISFKRHIVPLIIVLFLSGIILGVLNGPWIIAQLHYRATPRVATVVAITPPAPKPDPNAPAELLIPAINVKAPIIFDEPSLVDWKVQLALRKGVVHYGPTALPGQKGNAVIVGHSSGQAWAPGDYKWVFTLLDKLRPGDQIQVSYQGIPYVYEVTDSVVVSPTNLDVLQPTPNRMLSLVTCTPVGTSKNRLIVHATLVNTTPQTAVAQ